MTAHGRCLCTYLAAMLLAFPFAAAKADGTAQAHIVEAAMTFRAALAEEDERERLNLHSQALDRLQAFLAEHPESEYAQMLRDGDAIGLVSLEIFAEPLLRGTVNACRADPGADCLADAAIAMGRVIGDVDDRIESLATISVDLYLAGRDDAGRDALAATLDAVAEIDDPDDRLFQWRVLTDVYAFARLEGPYTAVLTRLVEDMAAMETADQGWEWSRLFFDLVLHDMPGAIPVIAEQIDRELLDASSEQQLAHMLLRAGDIDPALALLPPLDLDNPNQVIGGGALVTAIRGDTGEALAMLDAAFLALAAAEGEDAPDPIRSGLTYASIIVTLHNIGMDDAARQVAEAAPAPQFMSDAIAALVELGVMDKAAEAGRSGRYLSREPDYKLSDILTTLIEAGALDIAADFAKTIYPPQVGAMTMATVAIAMIDAGEEAKAMALINAAERALMSLEPRQTIDATLVLATALARAGEFERAEEMELAWRAFIREDQRETLRAQIIVQRLVREGGPALEETLASLNGIERPLLRQAGLRDIVTALAQVGDVDAARDVIDDMIALAEAAAEPKDRAYLMSLAATAAVALSEDGQ